MWPRSTSAGSQQGQAAVTLKMGPLVIQSSVHPTVAMSLGLKSRFQVSQPLGEI